MTRTGSRALFATAGAVAAGFSALTYASYRKEIKAARRRVEAGSQVIDTEQGPIEFAEAGDGPAVLLIHGAGGGFDQGIGLGRAFLGNSYRVIAPSRFGYLGTPEPLDASPEAQAEAYVRLLDTLGLSKLPVMGVSAGAPSAMQLCLKYPQRCSALILVVPMAYAPEAQTLQPSDGSRSSRLFDVVLNAVASSDFFFWTAMKLAHPTLLKTILGTPVHDYQTATKAERAQVDQLLREILPVSRRKRGIWNDGVVSSNLVRYDLEALTIPTLVISAKNDLYGTYQSGRYTAEHILGAQFVGYPTGGHLLLGHEAEVRSVISNFLKHALEENRTTAKAS